MPNLTKHFTTEELACKHCGLAKFHPGFLETFEQLRVKLDAGMTPTSGCRCAEHNASIPGHPRSLHVGDTPAHADKGQRGCLAVDIAAVDGAYRGRLFALAWASGWSIGWNAKKGFLHLDRRDFIGMPQTSFDY